MTPEERAIRDGKAIHTTRDADGQLLLIVPMPEFGPMLFTDAQMRRLGGNGSTDFAHACSVLAAGDDAILLSHGTCSAYSTTAQWPSQTMDIYQDNIEVVK